MLVLVLYHWSPTCGFDGAVVDGDELAISFQAVPLYAFNTLSVVSHHSCPVKGLANVGLVGLPLVAVEAKFSSNLRKFSFK